MAFDRFRNYQQQRDIEAHEDRLRQTNDEMGEELRRCKDNATVDLARNEILRTAHGLIFHYGWIQDDYGDRETGFCLTAALDEARRTPSLRLRYDHESIESGYYESVAYLQGEAEFAGYRNKEGIGSVSRWNDKPGRTRGEVLDLLAQAFIPGS